MPRPIPFPLPKFFPLSTGGITLTIPPIVVDIEVGANASFVPH